MTYQMPVAAHGYEQGQLLRDVSLAEARSWECNRCGDCCNGLSDSVKKDPDTGLPMFVWGSRFPDDLYEGRFGQRLLQPIGFLEPVSELPYQGEVGLTPAFEEMTRDDGSTYPYTAFSCSMLIQHPDGDSDLGGSKPCSSCRLLVEHPEPDPKDLSTIRPRNCGDFPVFGLEVDDSIIAHGYYVPPTGALPRCTWHGIRVTGPWKETPNWTERWERQQAGMPVPAIPAISAEQIAALHHKYGVGEGQNPNRKH